MDTSDDLDKDASWEKWRTEQVQTISQILSTVFKVEEEARQMQEPSPLLSRSSIDSPEAEANLRKKLTQIRRQISEYEELLKLGLKRIDHALEITQPLKKELPPAPAAKKMPIFKRLLNRLLSM